MRPSLIRNYLFISVGITLIFILLGGLALNLTRNEKENHFLSDLPVLIAKIIDSSPEKTDVLKQIRDSNFAFDIWFLNSDKTVSGFAAKAPLPLDLTKVTFPQN